MEPLFLPRPGEHPCLENHEVRGLGLRCLALSRTLETSLKVGGLGDICRCP
jgi:hypothetical protein